MSRPVGSRDASAGQVLVIVPFLLIAMLLVAGLVVDVGYYFAQKRAAQNVADFAALAATRVVAANLASNGARGTDSEVKKAIDATIVANEGQPVVYAAGGSCPAAKCPQYVDFDGNALGYVGAGLPQGAQGVVVAASKSWKPFFIGLAGVGNVSQAATATARTGYLPSTFTGPTNYSYEIPPGGNVLPFAISEATLGKYQNCDRDIQDPNLCAPSGPIRFDEEGRWNLPGGFGWLNFGCFADGGQDTSDPDACQQNRPWLQTEIGHPSGADTPGPKSLGCCTVPVDANNRPIPIRIGTIEGNKASADLSWYINNKTIVWLPVFNDAIGNGSKGYYTVIGFVGFQITDSKGAKETYGVLRAPDLVLTPGPATGGSSGTTNKDGSYTGPLSLGIQLVH